MVKVKNNPIVITCGDHERRLEECDPMTYIVMGLGACVGKTLRGLYRTEACDKSICEIELSVNYNGVVVAIKCLDTTCKSFNMLIDLVGKIQECYVFSHLTMSRTITLEAENRQKQEWVF